MSNRFLNKPLSKYLPKTIRQFIENKLGHYHAISLSDQDVESCYYKEYMGGGTDKWELRGAFQLVFLKKMGLRPDSRLLDIGCGPIRAGAYFIEYLDEGNYYGVDYNKDFITTARKIVEEKGLAGKKPVFDVIEDFNFNNIEPKCDYAIAFSVLNHFYNRYHKEQRGYFFQNISKPLKKGGRVYVSHTAWFKESYIRNSNLRLTNQFSNEDFDITKYGWETGRNNVFPIIELTID